jgi:hypothetical protein
VQEEGVLPLLHLPQAKGGVHERLSCWHEVTENVIAGV